MAQASGQSGLAPGRVALQLGDDDLGENGVRKQQYY
jgi:hypothetical protein